MSTFTRRQVVEVRSAGGRVERAVIIGAHPHDPQHPDWYVVQFDDACLSVHASNMRATSERAHHGTLRTYRQAVKS